MPSAVAISSYPGAVPISTLPLVFEAGVIEVIVLNKPRDTIVFPEVGPKKFQFYLIRLYLYQLL